MKNTISIRTLQINFDSYVDSVFESAQESRLSPNDRPVATRQTLSPGDKVGFAATEWSFIPYQILPISGLFSYKQGPEPPFLFINNLQFTIIFLCLKARSFLSLALTKFRIHEIQTHLAEFVVAFALDVKGYNF